VSEIRVGCSGWSYEDWRGRLYPREMASRRWLERYAEVFDTVEVNATFYRLPTTRAVERWAAETPPGFRFAIKASRYATHVRRLRDLGAAFERLRERIGALEGAGKLGPFLWQLPERFHRDDDRLAAALAALPSGRHAFELRHESWFVPEVYAILRAHDAALVVAHSARRALPDGERTAAWAYVRLHHGARGRRGNYSESELRRWARRIRTQRGDTYVFFNNDWEGFAVRNALRLRQLLVERPEAGRGRASQRLTRRPREPARSGGG